MRPSEHMPHQRIFADFDPVSELKKHNTPLVIAGRRKDPEKYWASGEGLRQSSSRNEVGRSSYSRQKKATAKPANLPLNITNSVHVLSQSHDADIAKLPVSKDGGKKHSALSNGRESVEQTQSGKLFIPSFRRPRASTGSSEFVGSKENQLKRSVAGVGKMKSTAVDQPSDGQLSSTLDNEGRSSHQLSNAKRSVNGRTVGNLERKRSASVPQGRHSSMAAIVRARSMAMKWYGSNKKRTGRQKLKGKNVLPTINDAAKFSLCSVSCSSHFAETIKLMEGDVDNTTSQIDQDLHVLSLD